MADIIFPNVPCASSEWTLVSNTEIFQSGLSGAIKSNDRTGERWRVRMQWNNLTAAQLRQLRGFVAAMRGQANRCLLRDFSYSPSGTLSVTQLAGVPAAADIAPGSAWSYEDIDDGVRIRRQGNTVNGIALFNGVANTPATVGEIYGARSAQRFFAGYSADVLPIYIRDTTNFFVFAIPDTTQQEPRYDVLPVLALGSLLQVGAADQPPDDSTGFSRWDWLRNDFARALLVDGQQNGWSYSEDFGQSYWTKVEASIVSNAGASPDGTANDADRMVESSANDQHSIRTVITIGSSTQYITVSIWAKAETRDVLTIRVDDNASTNVISATYDLTNELTSTTDTGNFDSPIETLEAYDNGWYRCVLTFRKSSGQTALRTLFYLNNGGGTVYQGDGSSSMLIWGAQVQTESMRAGKYTETDGSTSAAVTQTGKELWVKGLDRDTANQLRAGDMLEVNGQLVRLTAPLDGDRSGSGLASFEPRLRNPVSNDDPVLLYQPHGKFLLASNEASGSNQPAGIDSFQLEFIEDIGS